jgi:protein phosphatase
MVRKSNQDNWFIDPDGQFFLVADGMGGHAGGEEASRIAVDVIRHYLQERWGVQSDSQILLESAIEKANEMILQDQEVFPERADMGTTLVVLMFHNGQSWLAHVGDSRIYRQRQNCLEQLTEDDTWVARAIKLGELTAEEGRTHPWRHILSKCLGRRDLSPISINPIDLQPGDRLLLCSDGLTEELGDEEISKYLSSPSSNTEIAQALVEAAKANGGKDNITVVVVDIGQ